ncbi:type II toxin-antitoxin system RelB/DinJ family antitoxin [Varibaculum cambriense]|uniref:type II toxin-antitoxin system RelB/DinJ family antitoxin n=1 Tax=Varibaculum cambriense TaxID=184870 RepID=UPI0039F4D9E0
MANTSAVYARIDTSLKEQAEGILNQLGISPSAAIQMLYSQVVMQQGIPFAPRITHPVPVAIGGMTREEIDRELAKGIASKQQQGLTPDEVDQALATEFNL